MKTTVGDDVKSKLSAIERKTAEGVSGRVVTERAAAVEATRRAADELATAEADRLRRQLAALETERMALVARVEASAETVRCERAAELLARVFAAGSENLPALVDAFRREPARAVAMRIRSAWDALDAIAVTEIGEHLGPHLIGTLLVDSIVGSDPRMAGAINRLTDIHFGGTAATLYALSEFTQAAAPHEIRAALESAEGLISAVAVRASAAGYTPDPRCVELHALRRAHATYRDITRARAEVEARHHREALADSVRNAPPMPWRLADRVREHLSVRFGV